MKIRFWTILLLALITSGTGATTIENCPSAEVVDSHDVKMIFWQHQAADGASDLFMAQSQPEQKLDIKRVTFSNNKSQGCAYQALALAEGIGWGWHLAWADKQNIYFARMDGEAWVSSVPKKIAANNIKKLSFTQNQGLLTLCWQQADGISFMMQSDDEGRSWQSPLKISKD